MPMDEGRKLLAELEAHATSPAFVYAHQWVQGDLVMWDNRCLLHRALTNFDMDTHARILHRTVVRGTVPV
jgi:taurine dioxygenase